MQKNLKTNWCALEGSIVLQQKTELQTVNDGQKEEIERDGQPAFGLPPGEGFKHFLQHHSY